MLPSKDTDKERIQVTESNFLQQSTSGQQSCWRDMQFFSLLKIFFYLKNTDFYAIDTWDLGIFYISMPILPPVSIFLQDFSLFHPHSVQSMSHFDRDITKFSVCSLCHVFRIGTVFQIYSFIILPPHSITKTWALVTSLSRLVFF